MSSYNHLLKVFKESILEAAGLQEDARSDEFIFKQILLNSKSLTFENGIIYSNDTRGAINFSDSNLEYLPKDVKEIRAEVYFDDSHLKEINDDVLFTNDIYANNCKDLTKVNLQIKNKKVHSDSYNYYNINFSNCTNLTEFTLEGFVYRIDLSNCTKLSNIDLRKCSCLNIMNTNITNLPENFECDQLFVEREKEIIIPDSSKVTKRYDIRNSQEQMDALKIRNSKYTIDNDHKDFKNQSNDFATQEIFKKHGYYVKDGLLDSDLDLAYPEITEFPKDIKRVTGEIDISNSNIRELPDDLICGALFCKNCKQLIKLPNNLQCKYLHLENCSIKELSDNIVCTSTSPIEFDGFGGLIYIINCNELENIKTRIKCDRLLVLRCNKLTEINNNIETKDISFTDCNLTKVYDGITAKKLNISDNPINKLPENLQCHTLCISNTNITDIPESAQIKYLHCKNVKLNKLPNCVIINLSNLPKDITTIGSNTKLGGDINLSNSNLKNIFANINSSSLNVSNCKDLEGLPRCTVNNLNISNTKIDNINSLTFSNRNQLNAGVLDVSSTNVTKLPDNLHFTNLNISNTEISEVKDAVLYGPEGITTCLIAHNSKLSRIPKTLICEEGGGGKVKEMYFGKRPALMPYAYNELDISGTPITELPANLKVFKLNMSNTRIIEIPNTIEVLEELDLTGTNILELPEYKEVLNGFFGPNQTVNPRTFAYPQYGLNNCIIKGFKGDKRKYPKYRFAEEENNSFDEDDI